MPDSVAAPELPANRPWPHRAFNLLGPVEVLIDDVPVRLGGPGQVAVLARLLLSPGLVVSMEELADSVWEGTRPARPEVVIRSNISNLRRSIEPHRGRGDRKSCIVNHPPGYRLEVDTSEIDATRFEQLIGKARSELTIGRFAVARQQLDEASLLWRGEPCAGLIESDAVFAARSRIGELKLALVELRFEARLSLGEHEAVIPGIEAAIAENPRRERLTELGMRALYQAGRQSEALALCQRLRGRLIEELGIDPGPAIQALEHQILTHDVRLLPPVDRGALTSEANRSASPVRSLGPLGGRGREFEELVSIGGVLARGQGRMGLVTGEVGSGKSALVAAASSRLAGDGSLVVWGHCHRSARTIDLWPWGPLLDALAPAVTARTLAGLEAVTALSPSLHSIAASPLGEVSEAGAAQRPEGDLQPLGPPEHGRESSTASPHGSPWPSAPETEQAEPELGSSEQQSSFEAAAGEGRNLLLAQSVVELLRRVSSARPLVLVMEDAHWADTASIELLAMTASSLSSHPVAFIVTFVNARSVDSDMRSALQSLTRLPGTMRFELQDLDVDATAEVVELSAPSVPNDERRRVAHMVHDASGGNAFLTSEILGVLTVAGAGDRAIVGAVGSVPPTSAIRDWVLDRVERCHPAASIVLGAAGLFDGDVVPEALAVALELDQTHIETVLDAAVVDGLLAESASSLSGLRLRFRQPMVADVLADSLPAARRARLHGALAHALWRSGAGPADLAYHFARAETVGTSILAARFALDAVAQTPSPHTMRRAQEAGIAGLDALADLDEADPLEAELCHMLLQVARLRGDEHSLREVHRRLLAIHPSPQDHDAYQDLRHRASMIVTGRPVSRNDPAKGSWVLPPAPDAERLVAITSTLDESTTQDPLAPLVRRRLGGDDSGAVGHIALIVEAALDALRRGTSSERQRLALQLHGASPRALDRHDEVLMVRLALVSLLEMSPSTAVAEALSLVAGRPAILDVDSPLPPVSVGTPFAELDLLTLRVTIDVLHGRFDNAERGMDMLEQALGRSGFLPGALSGVQLVLAWDRGHVGAGGEARCDGADGSFRPPSVFQAPLLTTSKDSTVDYCHQSPVSALPAPGSKQLSAAIDEAFSAVSRSELERAATWLDRVVELADSCPAPLSDEGAALVAVAANRCRHRPAAALALVHLRHTASGIVTTTGGLAVLGPTAYFVGLAATTDAAIILARDRLLEAEQWSRLARAWPSLVRTLVAQAELDALDGSRDIVDARLAEAKAVAANIGMGWLDGLRLP